MSMRSFLAATILAIIAAGLAAPAVMAASDGVPVPQQTQAQPRHPDDLGVGDEGLLAGMPEPYTLVLLLGGLLASLILIRGPALRRAEQTVKRIPGDAP